MGNVYTQIIGFSWSKTPSPPGDPAIGCRSHPIPLSVIKDLLCDNRTVCYLQRSGTGLRDNFKRKESFDSVESSHVVFLSRNLRLLDASPTRSFDLLALSIKHSEHAILAVIHDITCHKIFWYCMHAIYKHNHVDIKIEQLKLINRIDGICPVSKCNNAILI